MFLMSCGFFQDLVEPEYHTTGDFSGKVQWIRKSTGETLFVANAQVGINGKTVMTDAAGYFTLSEVVTGPQILKIQKPDEGFASQSFPVTVTLQDTVFTFVVLRSPPRIDGMIVTQSFYAGYNGFCDFKVWDYDSNLSRGVVDWGDGSVPVPLTINSVNTGLPVRTSISREYWLKDIVHPYAEMGSYSVRATFHDWDGDSVSGQWRISVLPKPKPQLDGMNFNTDTLFNGFPETLWVSVGVSATVGGFISNVNWQFLSFSHRDVEEVGFITDTILAYKSISAGPYNAVTGTVPGLFSLKIPVNQLPRSSDFTDTLRNPYIDPGRTLQRFQNDSLISVMVLVQDGRTGAWNSASGQVVNRR